MAKASSRALRADYLVIRCSAPAGPVSLGILGTVKIKPTLVLLFSVGNSPKSIHGLDAFEMKLVSATPNAIRDDVNQLTSQNVPPDKLLEEVSHRYRGTIFASERLAKDIPATIGANATPEQILPEITGAILQLAKDEKILLSAKRKTRSRSARTAKHARNASSGTRRFGLPQQFGLATLHI